MKSYLIQGLALTVIFFFMGCAQTIPVQNGYDYSSMDRLTKKVHKKAETFIHNAWDGHYSFTLHEDVKIQSIRLDRKNKTILIEFNPAFSYGPMRQNIHDDIYYELKKSLGWRFRNYSVVIRTLGRPISELIPNLYRKDFDLSRIPAKSSSSVPHITHLSTPYTISSGLLNTHLAVWHSHGWYYNNEIDRWEWMRPRLFQTVEDLLPMSFTIPYLFPMLEKSGANLYVPRERDPQPLEFISDQDSNDDSVKETGNWITSSNPGYAIGSPPYKTGDNPFTLGTFRYTTTDTMTTSSTVWIADIPKTDNYAVYISYGKLDSAISDAQYTVHHAGGSTPVSINQQMGYETWVYLGTFLFHQGQSPSSGSVELTNKSQTPGKLISADAVRFGGGMGNIVREGKTSNRPRYLESSRYYLQNAGMPDSLYTVHADTNDYKDDYQRGEWVNYLKGKPYGPSTNREIDGLKIPIDLAVAFHTDAGIEKDSSVGTLAIYRLIDELESEFFPDSTSRMANRDLADIIQTQIVSDIQAKYDPNWTRRELWDADYRSARTPNVPTVLLELLSHQNFYDMQFALDPQFRFDVSRSIYKGILKYIANRDQRDYVVHPLPVDHFAIDLLDSHQVNLRWKPVDDPLENTAAPTHYRVYQRIDDGGFDNGFLVDTTDIILNDLQHGKIYSFKIAAVNNGGESFPSEILSVCLNGDHDNPVLIVNGFDRISGPTSISKNGFEGFTNFADEGVPDRYDLNFTGAQFDFSPESEWTTNDLPGHGASHADYETKILPGNTFDFVYTHGVSIKNAGYSFVSASDEAVEDITFDLTQFNIVDLILGEEKTSYALPDSSVQFEVISDMMRAKLTQYCLNGGNLFLSGAYIGTDLFKDKEESHPNVLFAQKVLKFNWTTDHASASGNVFGINKASKLGRFKYNQGYHPSTYKVESPDAIDPIPGVSASLLRYGDNHFSAGTVYQGSYKTVVLGFPFETIIHQEDRDELMKVVMGMVD